jgi:hypothetical protein
MQGSFPSPAKGQLVLVHTKDRKGYQVRIPILTLELDRIGVTTWPLIFFVHIDLMIGVFIQQLSTSAWFLRPVVVHQVWNCKLTHRAAIPDTPLPTIATRIVSTTDLPVDTRREVDWESCEHKAKER